MKRLIKRLFFSFILLITCPFFMLNASTQPEPAAENLVKEALTDLRDKSHERAQQNISLESALQEIGAGTTSRRSPAPSLAPQKEPKAPVVTATAPTAPQARLAAIQKTVIKPSSTVVARPAASQAQNGNGKNDGKKVVYGPSKDAKASGEDEMVQINEKLFVSAGESDKPFDPLAPRRDTFPGDKHTLSQMDKSSPLEATVLYRLDQKKSARLSINNDDESCPIYTPRPHDRDMTSAGIFLDMEVREDLQLEVGGHRRSMADETNRYPNGFTDTGTSFGFKYSF